MSAHDLKPCPWCGHKPRLWEHHAGGCEIECVNGHCPSEPHVGMPTTAEAITAWNTRAPLAEALAVPTDDQVVSACLSYRHDFGLLNAKERAALMWQAREWLHAWRKELAALRTIGGKA